MNRSCRFQGCQQDMAYHMTCIIIIMIITKTATAVRPLLIPKHLKCITFKCQIKFNIHFTTSTSRRGSSLSININNHLNFHAKQINLTNYLCWLNLTKQRLKTEKKLKIISEEYIIIHSKQDTNQKQLSHKNLLQVKNNAVWYIETTLERHHH